MHAFRCLPRSQGETRHDLMKHACADEAKRNKGGWLERQGHDSTLLAERPSHGNSDDEHGASFDAGTPSHFTFVVTIRFLSSISRRFGSIGWSLWPKAMMVTM